MIVFRHEGDSLIVRMSRSISFFFVRHSIIPAEDREVYEYSLEVLLSTALGFLAIFAIAVASRTLLYSILFLAGFIPLRLVAGGYHAQSHLRCFLILMLTYSAFLLITRVLPDKWIVLFTITSVLMTDLSVFLFAPSEDTNKPLSSEEIARLKKKSRVASAGSTIIAFIAVFLIPNTRIALSFALGMLTVGVSLLANFIKQKSQESD